MRRLGVPSVSPEPPCPRQTRLSCTLSAPTRDKTESTAQARLSAFLKLEISIGFSLNSSGRRAVSVTAAAPEATPSCKLRSKTRASRRTQLLRTREDQQSKGQLHLQVWGISGINPKDFSCLRVTYNRNKDGQSLTIILGSAWSLSLPDPLATLFSLGK